jgi:hypothetical protein
LSQLSEQDSYVKLENAVNKTLQFSQIFYEPRELVDPISKITKTVQALVCVVIREDGAPVSKTLSLLSAKAKAQLEGYIGDPNLASYIFGITKSGQGYLTQYSITKG